MATTYLVMCNAAKEIGFQQRVLAAANTAAMGFLSGGTPTADEITFSKKVVSGSVNIQDMALAALTSAGAANLPADPMTVTDEDITTQINAIAGALGKGWTV